MDIKVSHNWLKEFLVTKTTPQKIGECLALCGPSVERIHKISNDWVYDIEITTNRVDTASIMGIAREAATILPQFGIKAQYKNPNWKLSKPKINNPVSLEIQTDPKLNNRVMAVVLEIPKVEKSPKWITERLEASGVRSLNLVIDITNYVMLETGHPTHVFDFDKIKDRKLIFRLSKKGEIIKTLDGKEYTLPGNDIVIVGSDGEIIDLPGIMGTKNSVVSDLTKRIIFFIDNNDANLMRKTSLILGIRTMAVQLNEKNVDPQLGDVAFARGIDLFTSLAKAKRLSNVLDIYINKPKINSISTSVSFINERLGVELSPLTIKKILENLDFKVEYNSKIDKLVVKTPSFRSTDVKIAEDVVEEVARIYGYHNIPSELMATAIPMEVNDYQFGFEWKVKNLLRGWGGVEIYNLSLVSKQEAGNQALKIKNPLGGDTEYLRTTLFHTMLRSAKSNTGAKEPIHLFEMANIYLPQKNELPQEKLMLAGVFSNYAFRQAKGIIEALFESLHIKQKIDSLGKLTLINQNLFYYEFEIGKLHSHYKQFEPLKPLSKYPPQIEDITFSFYSPVKIGEVVHLVKEINDVSGIELIDIFKDNFTFRIWYQNLNKTLTDKDVSKLREKVILQVSKKFGGEVKN